MGGTASPCSARSSWSSRAARRSTRTWVISAGGRSASHGSRSCCRRCLLNYFGQGALLLSNPKAAEQPFFLLAPGWALLPLVGLATAAAIIASQALISGAFSLTRQAIQLGYCPRLDIEHTSSHEIGQVYVPQVNWALMISTIAIVIGFGSSTALAAAYGIAVTLTMVITAVLLHVVATERWRWPPALAFAVTGVFLTIDLAFFGANALKIAHGGWLPLVIGALAVHADDDVEDRTSDCRAAADGAGCAARGVHGTGRRKPSGPRAWHRGLHDGAAARHPAGARAQPAIQQGAPRARRHADGHDATRAPRVARRASDRSHARSRSLRRRRALRLHGGSQHPGGARTAPENVGSNWTTKTSRTSSEERPSLSAVRPEWRCGASDCSC